MSVSRLFVERPVGTTLLTLGVALAGAIAFRLLPVAPLPQVDFPVISVHAHLAGASPETMAATVAAPLERAFTQIAGVNEMTSTSELGSTHIVLQFDLDRNIDGAARDVQAAINAARTLLPTGMPSNPTYHKVNPASAPVLILGLTSDTMTRGQMYDVASTVLAQKLSQVQGVGEVRIGGSSLPAVRVELNPPVLYKYGIGLEDVRNAIVQTNANRPKGAVEDGTKHWQIQANDQAMKAADYMPIIVAWRHGAGVRLGDVAHVTDSVEDLRNAGSANGKPSVLVIITLQPGANIIATVDRVRALMPALHASIPRAMSMQVVMDRTPTIRASLHEVELALLISVVLVVLVVFLFLRNARAGLIPSVAVPVSLIGTFGVMYLCSYSLDNLSLMALAVATGFVVDDAIVVLENVSRHIEQGMEPKRAALVGAREVGFTVLSMSLSLVAVFIPILFMGGIVGRMLREFAVVLSVAVVMSLVLSLSTTPMMCAALLKPRGDVGHGRLYHAGERAFAAVLGVYEVTLAWALRHARFMMLLLLAAVCLNFYLYAIVPKGFVPQQDTGRLWGFIRADQSISFQAMKTKLDDFIRIVRKDPAVTTVVGFTGGDRRNTGRMFVTLKPLAERKLSAERVIARLRRKLAREPGAQLFLRPVGDVHAGGRLSDSEYQYTLQGDDLGELRAWEPRIRRALSRLPQLVDVSTDTDSKGLQVSLVIDRDTASRLGVTAKMIDATLNDAFGQRQVSTIYNPLNQYHVVMEAAPRFWQSPRTLKNMWVSAKDGTQVPLSAFAHYERTNTPLGVQHQGVFAATTISFNLAPGVSLSQATDAIQRTMDRIGVPISIHGGFQGTARLFRRSLSTEPLLILAGLITVYIVLGMLYESYVHPLTILSTLPSAGVGAILALLVCHIEFSIVALIGVILLIGIVKKNAIMMIDFAVEAERSRGLTPQQAIFEACLVRFRPIMMTTMAAMLGALPLALGAGNGAELRRPLGISIVGGLALSQLLTLYTTPVVYLYLDRFQTWCRRLRRPRAAAPSPRWPAADPGGR